MQTPELGSWDAIEAITGWRPGPVVYEMPEFINERIKAGDLTAEHILRTYEEWQDANEGIEQLWVRLAEPIVNEGCFVWDEEQQFLKWTQLADPDRWGGVDDASV